MTALYNASTSSLLQSRLAAKAYTDEEVEQLIERCREAGVVPRQEYFPTLARIKDLTLRRDVEIQFVEGRWSVRKLKFREKQLAKEGRPRGRAHVTPTSLETAVRYTQPVVGRMEAFKVDFAADVNIHKPTKPLDIYQ